MQASLLPLDHFKVSWVIEESVQKLLFLSKISREDGASSELASYEINKLLSEQARLEEKYAELLKVRTTLKGISNKRRLEEIQIEIRDIANSLKENTRKLGRMFRENPSFQKDYERVLNEKAALIEKLESIIQAGMQSGTQAFNLPTFQASLIDDLEAQDFLRKQALKEKTLVQEIKQIHAEWKKEEEEYQNIIVEKTAHLQKMKESLAREKTGSSIESKHKENELISLEGTQNRIQNQSLNNIQNAIEEAEEKKRIEVQAAGKIKAFLKKQEEQNKAKLSDWAAKSEETRINLENRSDLLRSEKAKAIERLQKLKEEFAVYDGNRREIEKIRVEKDQEKARKEAHEENVDGAIKAIQEAYNAWKEGGGVVKKSKKAKGGKEKGGKGA